MAGNAPADDQPEDLMISLSQLMKVLEDEPEPVDDYARPGAERLPKITRMPEGIDVTEHRLGHAVGHWVLQVRCECGRRWFEVDPVQTADCPRCGAFVFIDIDPK